MDNLNAILDRIALDETHARIRQLERLALMLINQLPESEIELAREVWGNTNTQIILAARRALAEALKAGTTG
jgi:hypothetical protein